VKGSPWRQAVFAPAEGAADHVPLGRSVFHSAAARTVALVTVFSSMVG
jgi:hypothetical protein